MQRTRKRSLVCLLLVLLPDQAKVDAVPPRQTAALHVCRWRPSATQQKAIWWREDNFRLKWRGVNGEECAARSARRPPASAHPPGTTPLVAMALMEIAVSMVCRGEEGEKTTSDNSSDGSWNRFFILYSTVLTSFPTSQHFHLINTLKKHN